MKYKTILILLLLAICTYESFSQSIDDENEIKRDLIPTDWKTGYIILSHSTDTLNGFINAKMSEYGEVLTIWFNKDTAAKKGAIKAGDFAPIFQKHALPKDTIHYFGLEGKRFKYVNYIDKSFPKKLFRNPQQLEGWCLIIEEGAINISKGFCTIVSYSAPSPLTPGNPAGGGTHTTKIPMYILKKGQEPSILIADKAISIFRGDDYNSFVIDDLNKEHFLNFISDDNELYEKIKNREIKFGEIENYIKEYNADRKDRRNK